MGKGNGLGEGAQPEKQGFLPQPITIGGVNVLKC